MQKRVQMLQSSTIKCKAVKALIQDASNSFQSPVQSGPKQSGVCFTVHILFLCAFVQQLKLNSMQGCALASVMYPMHCSQRSAKNWRGCTVHFQMKQLVMDQDLMHQFILILMHSSHPFLTPLCHFHPPHCSRQRFPCKFAKISLQIFRGAVWLAE